LSHSVTAVAFQVYTHEALVTQLTFQEIASRN
jgi:hypothetical protein